MGNKVNVTRYLRPNQFDPWYLENLPFLGYDNLYGITFIFEIDYEKRVVAANWSVCNGDNFDKKIGKRIAQENGQNYKFNLQYVEERMGLIDGLIQALQESFKMDMPLEFWDHVIFFLKAGRILKNN